MGEININGVIKKYAGCPLVAFCFDGVWSGRTNFQLAPYGEEPKIQLKDLADAFNWMRYFQSEKDYRHGYILDYETKTIYYDDQAALDHLLEKKLPATRQAGYFEKFVLKPIW